MANVNFETGTFFAVGKIVSAKCFESFWGERFAGHFFSLIRGESEGDIVFA